MTRTAKSDLSVLVLIAGLPAMVLLVAPAASRAQYQVGGDGHALDANNQVGSGGRNGPSVNQYSQTNSLNNNIITGNSTGLSYFHGTDRTFDPNSFRGNSGSSQSDRLDAISAPVDLSQRTTGAPTYTSYYNASKYTPPSNAPSPAVVQTPGGAGFVTAPVANPLIPTTDVRVGLTNEDPNQGNLPTIGELNVAGPADPTGNSSIYSMSPLYGVRQMDTSNTGAADTFFQARQGNNGQTLQPMGPRPTVGQLQQMRAELQQTAQVKPPTPMGDNSNPGNTNTNVNQVQNTPVTGEAIGNQITQDAVNTSVASNVANTGDLSTGQGVQSDLLIPAGKQSKQIKALEDKYAKLNRKLTDVEATQKLNAEMRAKNAMTPLEKKPGTGAKPGSSSFTGDAPVMSTAKEPTTKPALTPILTPADSAADNQPYVVTSLATGIPAKGLADLMKSAEDKMRDGKFTEAVDAYETAQSVAPNNAFVSLGRSFAELGASYYGKADLDLNRAIVAEPAVLAGKYDLNGFLGEDRVKFVTKDLNDIASHEKSARPLVLLGFIAHNTGDDVAASKYLDQAATRGGGYDSLIALMRSTWSLKTDGK